ncbi:hypothetical protein [Amycolatopsis sp. GM8]|uniref:hypothetical protein n=1 Tax=Amycolatopsis sp. GM8 TaxID=2896530 RepID=UPI001F2B8592|nr:hypothetical protein [Amycolatopsis sp. GM8]
MWFIPGADLTRLVMSEQLLHGHPVTMADGRDKPIDQVKVGDKVLTATITTPRAYQRTFTVGNLQIDGIHTHYAGIHTGPGPQQLCRASAR